MSPDDGGRLVPESLFVLFSNEFLIDAGLGTAEMVAELEAARAKSRAAWLALPFYVRWWRMTRVRLNEPRRRLHNVAAALRGAWEASDDE